MLFLMLCWKFTVQTNNFWPFIAASFWNSSSNDSFSAPSLSKLLSNSRSSVGCAKATKQSQSDFIWETRHQQEREWTVTSHNDFHLGFLSVGNSADVFSTSFACWIHFSLILCFFRMLMLPAVHRSLIFSLEVDYYRVILVATSLVARWAVTCMGIYWPQEQGGGGGKKRK